MAGIAHVVIRFGELVLEHFGWAIVLGCGVSLIGVVLAVALIRGGTP